MIFSANPARIISGIVNFPDPNTIAFGGVATGSMNAQLAARTTGIVKATGAIPRATATAPTTGKNVDVVATLEVISVRNIIKVATANIKTIGGTFSKTIKPCPIHPPSPDDPIDAARIVHPQIKQANPMEAYLLAPMLINLFYCFQKE